MKTKLTLASIVLLLGSGLLLHAQDMTLTNSNPKWYDSSSSDLYRPYDFSLEAFGVGTIGEHALEHLNGHTFRHHARGGAGLGAEFFLNRYIGIEAEGWSEDVRHNFVDNVGGNLMLRLPIGNSGFAPYIFGGAGHQFDPVDCIYSDGGAGFEYRFMRHFGVFLDGRYVIPNDSINYVMGRLGFKFTF